MTFYKVPAQTQELAASIGLTVVYEPTSRAAYGWRNTNQKPFRLQRDGKTVAAFETHKATKANILKRLEA